MAMMDTHTKAMREMREKMSRAPTPQERNAQMAEHMKLLQEGLGMMRAMGPMAAANAPLDLTMRHQMMDWRMEMMMDRMEAPAAKP